MFVGVWRRGHCSISACNFRESSVTFANLPFATSSSFGERNFRSIITDDLKLVTLRVYGSSGFAGRCSSITWEVMECELYRSALR
jgi:hypothetical protein